MTTKIKLNENANEAEAPKTDWRSIYVANIVAFLSSVQMGATIPTIWPYMKLMHPSVTENTYGVLRGAAALANIISSGLAGYASNRLSNTKPAMILGKLAGITGSIIYLFIEVFTPVAIVLFFFFDILHGVSMGLTSVFRTHIAMNSLESERSKAFGLTMLAFSLGFMVGPVLQILFTLFGYPGWPLVFGIHWNLYTAPVFLSFITSVIAVVLLIYVFDGRMHVMKKTGGKSFSIEKSPISNTTDNIPYDKVAVAILIFMKIAVDLALLGIQVSGPYTMTVFSWTSEQSVTYQSIVMATTGLCSLIFSLAYVFFKLDKRVSERICLFIAFGCLLFFYLITYPWFFIDETIPYEHVPGDVVHYSQDLAQEAKALLTASNDTRELVGCPVAYAWCQDTPRVNVYIYNICLIIAIGIGLPLAQINLDILFSKVLGPIKQGVHQAAFFGAGQILNVLGPVVVTRVYTATGPRWIWCIEIMAFIVCIIVFAVFYSRLIPYSKLIQKKSGTTHVVRFFK